MATQPTPDIEPAAPQEMPPGGPPDEAPMQEPPGFEPLQPDYDDPSPGPDESPTLPE